MRHELGKPLSWKQSEIYREIHRSGENGISSDLLCQRVFGDKQNKTNLRNHLRNIKDRLGDTAIITERKTIDDQRQQIFTSRRAKISAQVKKNISRNKSSRS